MSERMKKPLTNEYVEVVVHNIPLQKFKIDRTIVSKVISILSQYESSNDTDDSVPADEVFKKTYEKYGKIGAALRGYRLRDDLTQIELAKMLDIPQRHVSEMEHSKRPIGKKMAQKLAQIFKTDYRMFL